MSENNYASLTPRERLTLVVQAKARCDDAEVFRLCDSAPMQEWRIVDYDFTRARDAMREIVYLLCMALGMSIGKLELLERMLTWTPLLLRLSAMEAVNSMLDEVLPEGWRAATDDEVELDESGEATTEETYQRATRETREVFDRAHANLRADAMADAAAALASFDQLTKQVLNLEGHVVLRAWSPPIADKVEAFLIAEHAPDRSAVTTYSQVWFRLWNRKMGLKPPTQNGT